MGQCARSGAVGAFAVALAFIAPSAARAETVYEFAITCHEDQLNTCFNLIRDRLDRLKANEQGRTFCLPRS
jgi:serine/threonine protein kinase HipA of HipAB toxin-antitoxin module